jgi:hypothetical protein
MLTAAAQQLARTGGQLLPDQATATSNRRFWLSWFPAQPVVHACTLLLRPSCGEGFASPMQYQLCASSKGGFCVVLLCGLRCRRITPGSTSSLVARRRPSSSGKRQPQPTDTGYTGAYDFDAHLSTIKQPKWQLQQRQHYMEQTSMTVGAVGRSRFSSNSPRSPYSASPKSPVAALSFTPAPRGETVGTAAVAGSSGAGPRPLSGSFLGQGIPLSPPVLKQQPGFVTPTATSSRRGHTAQTDSKAAVPRGPTTASKGREGQDFGKVLWPLTEDSVDMDSAGSSMGSSLQPGELVPSRRRTKEQGGAAGKSAAAACATAPPKAPSSRTFARQRQQLAQELYAQWNVQVSFLLDCKGVRSC